VILEVAPLDVRDGESARFEAAFAEAQAILASMCGYRRHELRRCVESPRRYLLLVWWDTLEDHTVGFRGSAEYARWKALLHPFYDPFPRVEHYGAPRLDGCAPDPAADALRRRRTARLALTAIGADDLAEIERMHRDPAVMATLGGVRDDAETRRMVRRWIAHWDAHGFGLWIARDAATGAFAGRGGLQHTVVAGRGEIEVAYALAPPYWGRGLATELASASVRAAFEGRGLAELVCFALVTNRPSQRVMEKAGFAFEREVAHAGQPHRLARLRAADWRARTP